MDDLIFCVTCVGLALVLHSAWPIAIFVAFYIIGSLL